MCTRSQTTVPTEDLTQDVNWLAECPRCARTVVANVEAVRYSDRWYHLRCALDAQALQMASSTFSVAAEERALG